MKQLFTTTILCLLSTLSIAQTAASYSFTQTSSSYSAVSGGTTIFSGSWDDNTTNGLSIGFTFNYCGTNYTTFNINANGWINFGSSTSSSYTPVSARTLALSPLGRDLYRRATSGSGVVYKVTGSSPNRVLTIEWFNVCYYSNTSSGPLNFQIKLYETLNRIEFVYGSFSPTLSTSYTPQVGINGSSSSDYNNRTTTSNWAATTAGSSNTATCTSNNSVKPASGLTFRWCPPAPAITGTAFVCAGNTTTLANTLAGGSWASSNTSVATVNSSGVVTGVSGGTATITYLTACGYPATKVVTVGAAPSTPTGSSSVCTGNTITLTSSGTGTWTSSNPSIASVSSGGIVTGVSAGAANITYTVTSSGCAAFKTISVNISPAAISGSSSTICEGSTISLSNSTSGGTWSSSAPAEAAVGTSGTVLGVAAGDPVISYTLPNGCSASWPLTVNTQPAAISGATTVCGSLTTTLTNTTAGGYWSSSDGSLATVDALSGVVTGGASGIVTISYTMPTGCYSTHSIIVQPLSEITGTPSMCLGFSTTLSDATAGGTWSSANPLIATVSSGGVVTGLALGLTTISYTMPATGCTAIQNVAVTNPPTVYAVTGGGAYCADGTGVLVGTSGSDGGVYYQLYLDGAEISTPLSGTGGALSFGYFLTPGIYTIVANPGTACATTMAGMATIVINAVPPSFTVSGGGNYCAGGLGEHVYLGSSTVGVNYQLYNGTSAVGSPLIGTSTMLDFGYQTSAGNYSVVATDVITGCIATMADTVAVSIDPVPTAYPVTGGGAYCSGGSGYAIGLSNSATGILYRLYYAGSPIGTPVTGTGGAISLGTQTAGGLYSVEALDPATGCASAMTGTPTITVNSLPTAFTVTGGGNYCSGGSGVSVGLNSSTTGISYQLRRGSSSVGAPVAGTGSPLSFGMQTVAGTYTVLATNTVTGCASTMMGSVAVSILSNPSVFTVSGGGNYCAGASGVAVGLSNSSTGTNYSLYNSGTLAATLPGSGSSLNFGLMTTAGTYTVIATNVPSGCTATMTGSATVGVNPLPDNSFTVTGGGNYCSGGTGASIGLSGSESGINYQPMIGGTAVGAATSGTGSSILLGTQTTAGVYTVLATNAATTCSSIMTGSVPVGIDALPFAYTVTGGGTYCAGMSGSAVGLSNSNSGVEYQLYVDGSAVGVPMPGTGGAMNFGLQAATGTYTITGTNVATGCTQTMTGSVVINTMPAPATHTLTGGGNYCLGGTGVHIGLAGSTVGDSYELQSGGTSTGISLAGTGGTLDFGLFASAGTYSVIATNGATGCSATMGTTTIAVSSLPSLQTVSGGGNYCAGGSGVSISLHSSSVGVDYQLKLGPADVGSPVAGTGASLGMGLQTTAGIYTIVATDAISGCSRNMAGSSTVGILPAPVMHSVTGGGDYCPGGRGVVVGLSSSTPGTYYQLYRSGIPTGFPLLGTGSTLNFGRRTSTGSYTVVGTDFRTTCTAAMSGSAVVGLHTLPATQNVTGGGNYCIGGPGLDINLDGSETGIDYQLYKGTIAIGLPVSGTGTGISLGSYNVPGTYTVKAIGSISGCSATMTGSASIAIAAPPLLYSVTGGGDYCPGAAGMPVGLTGSSAGINYQLYANSIPVGTPVTGSGLALDFGLQSAPGNYTVLALSSATTCVATMGGSVDVNINPVPVVFSVTGGGSYCAGDAGAPVGLAGSEATAYYQLYNGSTLAGAAVPGTGGVIDFGLQAVNGTYSVVAANSMGCTMAMSGAVSINSNPLPIVYAVTGGGNYCPGGSGADVGLSYSDPGVSYQLYQGSVPVGTALSGIGGALSFGLQTAGSYSVVATSTLTGCSGTMSGMANVSLDATPLVFNVTGGGEFCAGGSGVMTGLDGSESGVTYSLYNGTFPTGITLAGTGGTLDFGLQAVGGTYTVVASGASSCTANMTGSSIVIENALPVVYNVTGGGSYCSGDGGRTIGLDGSSTGVNYRLYLDGTAVGEFSGTGTSVDFGLQPGAGNYTIVAKDIATTCTNSMAGTATIAIDGKPTVYAVTGGGHFCAGDAGVTIGLDRSETGVSYQLYNGTAATGGMLAGTGSALDFGLTSATGTYTVVATNDATGCTNNMSGIASVATDPAPATFDVIGGGSYCPGGPGVHIGLSGTQAGVTYNLMYGSTITGAPVAGTGFAADFGLQNITGAYFVTATDNTTSCTTVMTGGATISLYDLPATYALTGGGGYCAGGTGASIGLSGSNAGVSYVLYNGGIPVGSPAPGTDSAISFGMQTLSGTYTAVATDAITGCKSDMTGTASVTVHTLPATYLVVGGGAYCAGGSGVRIGLANSTTGVHYRLFRGSTPVGGEIAGTGFSLDFGTQTMAGTYTVEGRSITTGCVAGMTGSATVSLLPAVLPSVTISSSAGDTACNGTTVTLSATPVNGGSAPYFEWAVNGITLGSGNSHTYLPVNGDIVSVSMTSSEACAYPLRITTSKVLTVQSTETPTIMVSAAPGTSVCAGTAVSFTANPAFGGSMPVYSWIKNGIVSGSGASFTYTPENGDEIECMMSSNYHCRRTDNAASGKMVIRVDNPVPPVVSIAAPSFIAAGQMVTLTANISNGGTTPAIEWRINGNIVPAVSGNTLTRSDFVNGDVVTCKVTAASACPGMITTGTLTIHVSGVGIGALTAGNGHLQISPNPSKGVFNIKGAITTGDVSLIATDMLGKVVYHTVINNITGSIDEQIQLPADLSNGMYLLNLRSDSGEQLYHIVIEK